MFETTEPADWAALVPVVPPFDLADCTVEELAGWAGPDGDEEGTFDDAADPALAAAGWDALVDFEDSLTVRVEELDADATLVEVAGNRQAEARIQARRLGLAAHWADLHAVLARPGLTRPGG
jgi:hypothetical protein